MSQAVRHRLTKPRSRFAWTTDNYHRAIETGIFIETGVFVGISRLELINGNIHVRPRITPRQVISAIITGDVLVREFNGTNVYVSGKHPVTIAPHSEVEVSDAALTFDQTVRVALYAHAGIAEYWILNVNARTLEVYRNPQNGAYPAPTLHDETMSVLPLAAPPTTAPIAVADLLP